MKDPPKEKRCPTCGATLPRHYPPCPATKRFACAVREVASQGDRARILLVSMILLGNTNGNLKKPEWRRAFL